MQPERSRGAMRGIYPDVDCKRHLVSRAPVRAHSQTHKHTHNSNIFVNTMEQLHTDDQCHQRSGDHQ